MILRFAAATVAMLAPMWFADIGLALSLVLLAGVVAAAVLARLAGRAGWVSVTVRRSVWVGAMLTATLLVAQAGVVDWLADAGGLTGLDRSALAWFVAHRVGWATGLSTLLAWTGGPAAMALLAVVAVAVLVRRDERARAVVVAATALGAVALIYGFKNLYLRHRPPRFDQVIFYHGYSLPSGHALGSMVVVGVVTAAVATGPHSASRRVAVLAAAAVYVLGVGVSRVYLAAHWVTDVLTGWLLGGAWLAVGVTALVLLGAPTTRAGTDRVDETVPAAG